VDVGLAFKVLKHFDDRIKSFILQFPGEWTFLSVDLLVAEIDPLIDELKRVALFMWSSTHICRAPNSNTKGEVKDQMQLLHLIGLARECNNHLMPHVSLVFTFARYVDTLINSPSDRIYSEYILWVIQ
jgi:hypothetical protein